MDPNRGNEPAAIQGRSITASRVFDAPRELVWKVWTEPRHLARWWGPAGFRNTIEEMDVRAGGEWRLVMHGPDGVDYDNHATYQEVVAPERLRYVHHGEAFFEATVIFEALAADKTRVTVTSQFESVEEVQRIAEKFGAVSGLDQTLGRLGETLASFPAPVVIAREFDAERELVFAAWSDAKDMAKWFGPRHYTNTACEVDFRPGGAIRISIQAPSGDGDTMNGTYDEITPPERIVFSASALGGALQALNIVTFEARGRRTLLTLTIIVTHQAHNEIEGMREGWEETLDRLGETIAQNIKEEEFTMTRVFDAPRELVFDVWTKPEHLAQWWGPKGRELRKVEMDFRVGGKLHYGMRMPDGVDVWGRWIIREIVKPELLVFVNSFSDEHGGIGRHPMAPQWPAEMLSTIRFEDVEGGRTRVTIHWVPVNATSSERKLFADNKPSMNAGWSGSFEALDAYLATMGAAA